MSRIVVAGVASLQITVPIRGFPIEPDPTGYPQWVRAEVCGTGASVAGALQALGDEVRFCTVVGRDAAGTAIRTELARLGLDGSAVAEAPVSSLGVALVAPDGRRAAFAYPAGSDSVAFPPEQFVLAARDADLAVVSTTVFAGPLLPFAVAMGIPVAVDVHMIGDLDDPYDRP